MAGVDEQPAAVRLMPTDNVATLLAAARAHSVVAVRNLGSGESGTIEVMARTAIPAGHKIALSDIQTGGEVRKYGLPIAHASTSVCRGEHVHVHNAVSTVSAGEPSREMTAAEESRIAAQDLRTALRNCLHAADVPAPAANHMADHVVEAHLRGVETHGIRRLKPYIKRIRADGVALKAEPRIEESGGVLRIDGCNGIGHHVGAVAADAVAKAAKSHGVAVALVRNSNHFGFAGYYATRIAAQGAVAMVTSNGQVLVGPEGAKRAFFSNNPIAIAAPLSADAFFEFDMATSVTSRAKIVQASAAGTPIAPGLALDAEGRPTTDAKAAAAGILLPFGGSKGFALIAAIELLTGILSGGAYADQVASKEVDASAPEGTAHFMLSINMDAILGHSLIEQRLNDMVERMAALPIGEGATRPRHPGARRWALRRERLARGIPLSAVDTDTLCDLGREFGAAINFRSLRAGNPL